MSRGLDINSLNVVSFLEWVREQDPDKTYLYLDTNDCPVISFARSIGWEASWGELISAHPDQVIPLDALVASCPGVSPRTHGQLASHLEESTR
jgi:hypothetical protein